MNDQEAVQWINENAPAEMRWWIHDRLRYLPGKKEFEQCPNCGGSEQTPNACEICDPHGINYQQPDQTMSLTDLKYAKEEVKKLRAENAELRKSLESALLRCNHGHDEEQDHCLCWQCEDDRKALNSQHNIVKSPDSEK
jgi:hypothetical protein